MKNKRNTGLRAGVYQESSDQKSTLFDLLASILIFLALAAIVLHGKRLLPPCSGCWAQAL